MQRCVSGKCACACACECVSHGNLVPVKRRTCDNPSEPSFSGSFITRKGQEVSGRWRAGRGQGVRVSCDERRCKQDRQVRKVN